MTILEKIAGKTRNIKTVLMVVKILEVVLTEKWYSTSEKDTWSLIYLVNFIFDLHDIFLGSFIASRLVNIAHGILMEILEERKGQINLEQSYEINSLLAVEAIKGSQTMLLFESNTRDLKQKLASTELKTKIEGINELQKVLQDCYNFQDQLNVFVTKCPPLIKTMLTSIDVQTVHQDEQFGLFITVLRSFFYFFLFDEEIVVQIEDEKTKAITNREYEVDHLGALLND